MGLVELAIIAFVISLIAGALGFSGISEGFATIAKWLFGLFLVIAIILILLFALGISIVT